MKNIVALLLCLFLAIPANAQSTFIIGNPIAPIKSAAAETSHVMKASQGFLYSFGVSSPSAAGYLMIIDSATVPADGAVTPTLCYPVGANQSLSGSFYDIPDSFINGIVFVFSTTGCFTKTTSATAFFTSQSR